MSKNIAPPSPRYVGPAKWKGAGNNKPIRRIVIHATVGSDAGQDGAAENTIRFSKNTDRPSSYHYIADHQKSLQYVFDGTVAFHAPPNGNSIGYELCCSLTNQGKGHWDKPNHQAMLKIVAKDVARLCLAYDIPIRKIGGRALKAGERGICGHSDVRDAWGQTTHWDPGPFFPWKQFINLVNAYAKALQADAVSIPQSPVSEQVRLTRGVEVEKAIAALNIAAKRAAKAPVRLKAIQAALQSLRTIKPS